MPSQTSLGAVCRGWGALTKIRRSYSHSQSTGGGYLYRQRDPPQHTNASIKILIEERLRSSDVPPSLVTLRYVICCTINSPIKQERHPPHMGEGGVENTVYPPTSIQTHSVSASGWGGGHMGDLGRKKNGGGQTTNFRGAKNRSSVYIWIHPLSRSHGWRESIIKTAN